MRRLALPAVVVVLLAGLIAYEALGSGSGSQGEPAPPLPGAVMQGPKPTLASLRGAPALVNFWASWCEPCRAEAPQLQRLQRSLPGTAQLVGVDYTDRRDNGRAFVHRYGWTFPVLEDPDGVYGARFGFSGLPTTVVLDSRGRIVETLRGPQTATDLRRALDEAQ